MFREAIALGHATAAEYDEVLVLPSDGTEKQQQRIVELLKKLGIRQIPADPVGDGLIQIWPPPVETEKLWEDTKRETVNGVTSIELKYIGPAQRKRSRKRQTKEGLSREALTSKRTTMTTNPKPELPPVAPIQTGRYRHYKGKEYEVIGVARHSETLEELVVYRPLYGDHGLWVRPRTMFTGSADCSGITVPRFAYVGPMSVAERQVHGS